MISFRPYTPADLLFYQTLAASTFRASYGHLNDPAQFEKYMAAAFDLDYLRKALSHQNSLTCFLQKGADIIGYFKINWGDAQTEDFDETYLEIERIYVLETHQGQGLGALMIAEVVRIAQEKGFRYIWLGVWDKNPAAIRFYEREGFEVIGDHSFFIGDVEQVDLVMRAEVV